MNIITQRPLASAMYMRYLKERRDFRQQAMLLQRTGDTKREGMLLFKTCYSIADVGTTASIIILIRQRVSS